MATNNSVPEHLTQARQTSTATSSEVTEKKEENLFECHVCLEAPREPVVTPCGHLYCWPCLFRWLRMQGQNAQCPVCKAAISRSSVIPIYGRGGSSSRARNEEGVPPRPSGHREQPPRGMPGVPHFGVHHPTFGRFNPYGAGYENVGLSAFGFFPNLFGMQIAYPHMNEPPREEPQQNEQEDGLPDIVAKIFLLLTVFIAVIITTF
ncbi:RING finger protein 5 [Gracilariopsis chorda]|uniref:RING-type E3 ubiquitin transferase n=1 Tax=Gracilariopsis chorda TaxID=448386 RepID=A0A2V3IWD6_9FLOR|nr:RING finger protein 5 [Gracilariopsis chorda]|eukprot:PXF46405.1 RING finger protein 5 [Gracilariopsis chorda]